MLKRHDVGVSHNPESNMKLASGTAPVTKYLAAGVALGLGTDGAASNNDLDMFEAMRQASFLAKLATRDPTAVSGADRARPGDDRRRAGARHGAHDRIARSGEARRSDYRVDEQRAADAALRPGVAPRLRHARRRRADDDRERESADAGPPGADAERRRGHRRGQRAGSKVRAAVADEQRSSEFADRPSRTFEARVLDQPRCTAGCGTARRNRGRSRRRTGPRS